MREQKRFRAKAPRRKGKLHILGLILRIQHAVHSFFASLRISVARLTGHGVKTIIVVSLGFVCALLSGCASSKTTSSVERLRDGRNGFVLREKAEVAPRSRTEFDRAVVLLNEGKNEAAIELLKTVIDRSPELTAPRIDIALAYQRTGNSGMAEQNLKAALTLVPGHPAASNEYGLLLRTAGRFKEAREVYEKALEAFPDYLPARRNLGILCDIYLNDPACALKQFELYSEAMPADEKVKMWVAELRMRMGRK